MRQVVGLGVRDNSHGQAEVAVAMDAPVAAGLKPDRTEVSEVPSAGDDGLGPERVPFLERLLVRRLQRGDARAFRELTSRYQDRVFSLSLRMLGDPHEAQDVAQEVFFSVFRGLPRFRGDSRLSTWIYRVTRNHCLNRLKYLERRACGADVDFERMSAPEGPGALASRVERPDAALFGAEERAAVQAALSHLPPEQRMLVVLRDIEGLSYEEMARIAELPVGTVKSRIHRARTALAERLAAAGMVPDSVRKGP